MAKIIDKNTPLPCSDKRRFANSIDYMSSLELKYMKEKVNMLMKMTFWENLILGELHLLKEERLLFGLLLK